MGYTSPFLSATMLLIQIPFFTITVPMMHLMISRLWQQAYSSRMGMAVYRLST